MVVEVFIMKGIFEKNSKEAISLRTKDNLRHGRHCVFKLHVHLVFVTKYRQFCITQNVLDHLQLIMSSVCKDFEAELSEFNGEGDHVHLLVNYPPKISISKLVNSLKGVSSRHIRKANYTQISPLTGTMGINHWQI